MKKELIADKDPKSPISEIFRTLRTNIQFMNIKKKAKTLLVTSTYMGEGKSWVSSNLAVTFAQAGKKVILIDADMRKGRQYSIFKASPKPGLSDYLSQIEDEDEVLKYMGKYLQETDVDNLYLISAGSIPPNPSELLVSEQMINLLNKLKELWDVVIIDGAPCELVTDSIILSGIVDSTVIVTAYNSTKKDALRRTIKNIQNVEGKIAGVIINKIPISGKKYGENYYYYGNDIKDSRRERTEEFRKVDLGKIEKINEEKIKKVIDVNKQDIIKSQIIDSEKIDRNNIINKKNEALRTRNDLLENNETLKRMKEFILDESKTIEDKEQVKRKKDIFENENKIIENKEPIKRKKKIAINEVEKTENNEPIKRKKKAIADESKLVKNNESEKRKKKVPISENKEIEKSELVKRKKKVATNEEKTIENNKRIIKKKKLRTEEDKLIQKEEKIKRNTDNIDVDTIIDDKILNISRIKKINNISEENNVLDISDILKISS